MNPSTRLISCALVVALRSPISAGDPAPEIAKIRDTVARGLRVVEKAARSYPGNRTCFSCHHQTLPLLAMAFAREKGLAIDHDLFREQLDFTHQSFAGRAGRMKEGEGVGGASMTVGYGLWALEIGKRKPDATTSAMVSFLLKRQEKNGSWKTSSNRPPLEESSFTCSILAVYYMGKVRYGRAPHGSRRRGRSGTAVDSEDRAEVARGPRLATGRATARRSRARSDRGRAEGGPRRAAGGRRLGAAR